MKLPIALIITGIGLLLLGGIPGVLEFMSIQGFPLNPTFKLFPDHWFLMIYGFFGALIGNEILVALSVEWIGKPADDKLILGFLLTTLLGSLTFIFEKELGLIFTLISMLILLYYSQEYLGYSRLGLKPTTYNYLLFFSLMISTAIVGIQLGIGYEIPYLNLVYPASLIIAVMNRDISLVTNVRVSRPWENVLAFVLLVLAMSLYPNSQILLFLAWLLSFHASGIYRFKGRKYPIVHLFTAWTYLLIASIFISNYDIYIHAIAVGFLFNTVFGVDVVLMDMFINAFGKRLKSKPSFIPYILVNLGLVMRILYDLGFSTSFFILSAPLQGFGIVSFFILTFRKIGVKV